MDVDPPAFAHPVLKRCSSAPMINDCDTDGEVATATPATITSSSTTASPSRSSPPFILCSTFEPRTRRFSASFSPLHSPGTPGSPRVPPSRVSQLKKEEACDVVNREVASEKEFQSTLAISASWEDLSLSDNESKECKAEPPRRPSSACTEPIHVVTLPNLPSPFVSSPYPSPTRVSGRQCFSPSMQIPVRNSSFSPTPSPSPTRKTFYTSRRSLSPIAIRPSPLGPVKRKCDLEERGESGWIPHKKYQHYSPSSASSTFGGGPLLVAQLSSRYSSDYSFSPIALFKMPSSNAASSRCSSDTGDNATGPAMLGHRSIIPTPDSQSSSSPSDSGSPLQACKIGELQSDSPVNSPGSRRGSESSGSRSRDRSTNCVVPSPLAATCSIDDGEASEVVAKSHVASALAAKERKDFSRLFVPIPPSPGAMDVEDPFANKNSESVSKEHSAASSEFGDGVMDMEEAGGIALSQEQSMSVDSSHSPPTV